MGYVLANEVRDHWQRLGAPARALAFIIASRALDEPKGGHPAREYWGGHDQLVWDMYGARSEDSNPTRYASAHRNVSRLVRELMAKGYLDRTHEARRRGDRPRYRINPPPVDNLPA